MFLHDVVSLAQWFYAKIMPWLKNGELWHGNLIVPILFPDGEDSLYALLSELEVYYETHFWIYIGGQSGIDGMQF